MNSNSAAKYFLSVVLFLVFAFLTGCATAPPVDWNSRVGHFTYAQAVNELGSPNRQVWRSDGKTEFRWFVQTTGNTGVGGMNRTGINYNGMNNDFGTGPNINPGLVDRYLQLTFDANGVLTDWSKNY